MFFNWLQRIEVVKENPLDFVKSIRQPRTLPKYLTEVQQKALLEASEKTHPYDSSRWGRGTRWTKYQRKRDRVLILILLDSGLRISEVCRLRKTDIDLQSGVARILGKGGKEREVILSDRSIEAIKECLESHSDFLLFNQQKKHLDTRHAFRIIREIGDSAGILGLHPHLLRHTFATNLRRKGCDLLLLKESLGHASVATTELYAHIGGQEFRDRLRELIN